ncbi:TRAP transporter large permease [Neomoorella mulderi]|uniref:Sialic acid TRAP transporter permease protein SiaT n=1 Tax=Moorella mulderi DSM 14980 TaxID=1122241 RepID=A0A151AZN7_9FIRM|nr:TRAP transporter large permease [Moorella mulderi]KYH33111.1 sialic acid TRAP transporter permease protein SiaT [Moorella mulderi DSM 14980]
MLTIILLSFAVLLVLGVPITFSMGFSAVLAFVLGHSPIPWLVIPQRLFVAMDSFPLMAIPLFILAGELMNTGGITSRIVQFASSLVRHIRGGFAHVTIVASMIFAGISGAAAADASAIGAMMVPAMEKSGYDRDYAVAVTASAATIGPIIPPSILMIIYGSITGLSIGGLFLGGFIPGILVGLAFMLVAYIIARKRGYGSQPRASLSEVWSSFKGALAALLMPVIILGGILSGVFTATEAGVIAVAYGFIVGLFITRELKFMDIKRILVDSAVVSAVTMLIIAAAQVMGWILAIEQAPRLAVNGLLSLSNNGQVVLMLLLAFLYVLGFFFDGTAAMILLVPLFQPIVAQFGFDPIFFADLVIITILVGCITPPVGITLFISCSIAKVKLTEGSRAIWPFVAAMLAVVALIAFFPSLITFLPNLILKH